MRSSLATLRRGLAPRRLAVFIAGLLLLGAGCYGWLRLPDSSVFYIVLQAACGLLLVAATGALLASTVASLAGGSESQRIRKIVRCAPMGALVLVVAAALYWAAGLLETAGTARIYVLASWLSFHLNLPVPIPPFRAAWGILFLFVYLVLLPAFAIRAMAGWLRRSRKGPGSGAVPPAAGSRAETRPRRANFFLFWTVAIVLVVLFDWLPWKLAWWAPRFHAGWAEVLSALLRLGIAGIVFACGLLIQWSWYIGGKHMPAAADGTSPPSNAAA